MAITAIRRWRARDTVVAAPEPVEVSPRPFRRALVISLLNPKAILFLISFFVQFIDPSYQYPVLSFLLLAVILQLCSALYLSALIFGGTYLAAQFRRRRRLASALTAGVGALFVGFGIRLATASLG
jgi:leucine efflux protein